MTRKSLNVTDAVYDYLLSVSLKEPEILRQCREETAMLPLARMQIAPEQGQFFQFLIQSLQVKTAIEVGVYTGYSSLAIALALPADGTLIACDHDPEVTRLAQQYWEAAGVSDRIELRLGPALQTLDDLLAKGQTEQFDFAFIDADKPEYIDYYERLLRLVRRGGVIAIDNVLWYGQPADPGCHDQDTEAIRRFNTYLFKDSRVRTSLIPMADGITLALKK